VSFDVFRPIISGKGLAERPRREFGKRCRVPLFAGPDDDADGSTPLNRDLVGSVERLSSAASSVLVGCTFVRFLRPIAVPGDMLLGYAGILE
jgi:hypothetical protein